MEYAIQGRLLPSGDGQWRFLTVAIVLTILPAMTGCIADNPVSDNTDPLMLPEGYEQRFFKELRYGLFVPPSYNPERKYPLIVRLHGRSDTTSWDLVWYHEPIQTDDPVFVLTPKSNPESDGWGHSWNPVHSPDMRKTLEVIDQLKTEFNLDEDRFYVHGASMGGYGVLSLLAKEPGMFAAGVSICGGGDPATAAEVSRTPLWLFHGDDDHVIPAQQSRDMYDAILAAGGVRVRYTEYPGVGHEAWTPAWQEPTLIEWILAQHRLEHHGTPDPPEEVRFERVVDADARIIWTPPSDLANPDNAIWHYRIFTGEYLLAQVDTPDTLYVDKDAISPTADAYSVAAVNFWFGQSELVKPE